MSESCSGESHFAESGLVQNSAYFMLTSLLLLLTEVKHEQTHLLLYINSIGVIRHWQYMIQHQAATNHEEYPLCYFALFRLVVHFTRIEVVSFWLWFGEFG